MEAGFFRTEGACVVRPPGLDRLINFFKCRRPPEQSRADEKLTALWNLTTDEISTRNRPATLLGQTSFHPSRSHNAVIRVYDEAGKVLVEVLNPRPS